MRRDPTAAGPIRLVDAEAGGDVSRVIVGGVVPPPGRTLLEQVTWLRRRGDDLRRLLLYPPHGEPSMSANLVVPAVAPGADAGFLIMEAMGYPFFSGSNALCTAAVLLERGLLPDRGPDADRLVLESPAGAWALSASRRDGRIESIGYRAPAAFVSHRDRAVLVAGSGRVRFDVVYGGVFYAVVAATASGLHPGRSARPELAAFGGALVAAARPGLRLRHPDFGPAGPLAFVLFVDDAARIEPGAPVPIAAYVHPGVICHSPSGTGTSALLAWLALHGRVSPGARITTVSPEGGRFEALLRGTARVGRRPAVLTEIRGRPRILGERALSRARG